jgi:hypothetical protein
MPLPASLISKQDPLLHCGIKLAAYVCLPVFMLLVNVLVHCPNPSISV